LHATDVLSDIGTAIVAATAAALLARALRQPLILGYLLAGIAVGPAMGLGLVKEGESVELISEIGLILLLFIIGLEMDLQKLKSAGRSLLLAGVLQFPIGVLLGLGFAALLGFGRSGGRFDAGYVAVAMALSSTLIVVKLLYDKHELMTLPGRITLGVLVFQDVWAILVLAIQPTLLQPSLAALAGSVLRGAVLVLASFLASRYALPRLFAFIAKVPELLLVTALAWCFLVSSVASGLGLSREMGALIAGVSLSTFPYNLDVIAKVVNIRDFFVTLFFVALGMRIPIPTTGMLWVALAVSSFLVASRFLSVFPVLYASGANLRTSLLPSINLAQMSEFSLVIAALGLALGHVESRTVGVLTFAFALTSVASTYMIAKSHELQSSLGRVLERLGLKRREGDSPDETGSGHGAALVFLGFYRDASSIVHQFEIEAPAPGHPLPVRRHREPGDAAAREGPRRAHGRVHPHGLRAQGDDERPPPQAGPRSLPGRARGRRVGHPPRGPRPLRVRSGLRLRAADPLRPSHGRGDPHGAGGGPRGPPAGGAGHAPGPRRGPRMTGH
jgi:Kef-type K+ transport system membrane component KefB